MAPETSVYGREQSTLLRPSRHKTTAPQKYLELERRLKSDPRLGQVYAQ